MPPPTRRRGTRPDAQTLDELKTPPAGAGRLRKAPAVDPVLGASNAADPTETENAPRAGTPARSRTAARARPAAGTKSKVGFYQVAADTGRARAAYDWTRPQEGHRSFSDFIAAGVMREVERLEAKYHDGQPWPALEPGELPTGAPMSAP